MASCRKCGRENPDHYRFCLGCGADLEHQRGQGAWGWGRQPAEDREMLVGYLVDRFQEQTGIDLVADSMAMERLRPEAQKAAQSFSRGGSSYELNLPFLTADATGPKHMNMEIYREAIERSLLQGQPGPGAGPGVLVLQSAETGELVRFSPGDGEVSVGRDSRARLPISEASLSRRHAVIRPGGQGWMIEDLGSSNGTFVNGQMIQRSNALQPGDEVTFGVMGYLVLDQGSGARVQTQLPAVHVEAAPSSAPPPRASVIRRADPVPLPRETLQDTPEQAICGRCGATIPWESARCPACGVDPLLDGRFKLEAVVGRGAAGSTYRARQIPGDELVAIKELSVRRVDSIKMLDLFEREANVLMSLSHPAIPAYIDDFTVDSDRHVLLCLVQTFVDGRTLQEELKTHRHDEIQVIEVMLELLQVLDYLHDLRPQVVHRDIKPRNVMRRADGSLALIDFGSVRELTQDPAMGGSTVAGTFGFMAPEQLIGVAVPATDIYGVAATAVALLTRREPRELLDASNRLIWEDKADASRATTTLLREMLHPDHDQRPTNAMHLIMKLRTIKDALEGGRQPEPAAQSWSQPPQRMSSGPPPNAMVRAPSSLPHQPPAVYGSDYPMQNQPNQAGGATAILVIISLVITLMAAGMVAFMFLLV